MNDKPTVNPFSEDPKGRKSPLFSDDEEDNKNKQPSKINKDEMLKKLQRRSGSREADKIIQNSGNPAALSSLPSANNPQPLKLPGNPSKKSPRKYSQGSPCEGGLDWKTLSKISDFNKRFPEYDIKKNSNLFPADSDKRAKDESLKFSLQASPKQSDNDHHGSPNSFGSPLLNTNPSIDNIIEDEQPNKLKGTPLTRKTQSVDMEGANNQKKVITYEENFEFEFNGSVDQPGTPISRFDQDFEELKVLGEGSYGFVFHCKHKSDGQEYAVKKIKRKINGKNKGQINEAQILAKLNAETDSQYVLRYFNSWIEKDLLFIVMEYCPNSIPQIMKEQKHELDEQLIKKILHDICESLKAMHDINIVHLDIKPENIIQARSGKFKLADLGHARIAEKGSCLQEGDGKYMAPELLDDEENIEYKLSDIFSLGMSMYEIITGSQPQSTGEEFQELRKGKLGRLDQQEGYSDSLKDLIKKMLAPKPIARPNVQQILQDHLPNLKTEIKKTVNQQNVQQTGSDLSSNQENKSSS